jgi:choline dehydrogenase-like flavoprotein
MDLGFVKLNDFVYDTSIPLKMAPHAHHMGTTRMAASPQFGVVDANCKVFGTENLYVAGSSIFARRRFQPDHAAVAICRAAGRPPR